MRRLVALLATVLVLVWPAEARTTIEKLVYVERVVDGDTFVTKGGERVRLIGVDTPETVRPGYPVECYGPEASAFSTRHLQGDRVGIEFDRDRRDRYGRLLGYVHDSRFVGRTFNWVLVRRGYGTAKFYSPNFKYRSMIEEAQRKAALEDRGLWGACGGQT